MNKAIKIFCDFDGTLTKNDVWMEIGEEFIEEKEKWKEVIRKFEQLEIGARECFSTEASLMKNFDLNRFNAIIDAQEMDSCFIYFKEYCKRNNFPIVILSEGMDYYIGRILNRYNIELPYYANRCVIGEDGKSIGVEFPYSDAECTKCGCCKKNFIMNFTSDDEVSVYIGDGFSDICAVKYSDIIFAKKSLASYCWKNNITYFEYRDFFDIERKIEKLIKERRVKHRMEAKMKRRNAFLGG